MKAYLAAAALALSAFAAPASAVTIYDPAVQGPMAANFLYGYTNGGGFIQGSFQSSGCPIGGTTCYVGPASFLGVYFAPVDGNYQGATLDSSEVTLHPGPGIEQAAIQFIAPTTRTYQFSGFFRTADRPNGNGITFATPASSGTLGSVSTSPFAFSLALAAGQAAQFSVGNNGNFSFDTTGLSLQVAAVPEPATWAMMIMGFGLIGGAMRYRARSAKVTFATA